MDAIQKLLDKAAGKCSPSNDSALARRMHVSRSAVSLWRNGGAISEKHLTALIVLADVDPSTALQVLQEQAETKAQETVWSTLAKRLGAVAAVLLVAALPLSAKASIPGDFAITGDTAHYVTRLGYYWGVLRDWLAHRLHRPEPASGVLEARTCL